MKLAATGLAVLIVVGGAGVAIAIKSHHDSQVAAQHRRAAAMVKARAEAAARSQHEQETRESEEIAERKSLESQLETSITKDATQKANEGVLTSGPAQSTTCTPVSGGSSQNLTASVGTFSCLAIYESNSEGTGSGYTYSGTIDFPTGTTTWHLGSGG